MNEYKVLLSVAEGKRHLEILYAVHLPESVLAKYEQLKRTTLSKQHSSSNLPKVYDKICNVFSISETELNKENHEEVESKICSLLDSLPSLHRNLELRVKDLEVIIDNNKVVIEDMQSSIEHYKLTNRTYHNILNKLKADIKPSIETMSIRFDQWLERQPTCTQLNSNPLWRNYTPLIWQVQFLASQNSGV